MTYSPFLSPGSTNWILTFGALFGFAFTSVTANDPSTGLPTGGALRWPDGTTGTFTGTIDAGGNGYSGYTATYAGLTTRTLTASGITYDANGNAIGPTGLAVS